MSLYHVSLSVNGEVVVKYHDCCFKMYLNRIFKYTYSEFLKGNVRARWSDFVYINCGSLLDWIWDTQVTVKELVHLGTAEALSCMTCLKLLSIQKARQVLDVLAENERRGPSTQPYLRTVNISYI